MAISKQTKRPFGVHFFSSTNNKLRKKQWYVAIHAKNRTETWRASEANGYTRIAGSLGAYASLRKITGATTDLPAYVNGVSVQLIATKTGIKILVA